MVYCWITESFVSFIGQWACMFSHNGGGRLKKDVHRGRGVKVKAEECGQGEGGGPKSRKFCGRPLWMVPLDKYSRETFLYDSITQYWDKLMSRERLSITLQVENNILPSFMQSSSSRIPWRAACATLRLPRNLPRSDRDLYNSPQNAFCHPANQIVVFRVRCH